MLVGMEWLSVVTGIVGMITGAVGLGLAHFANRQSKEANRIAERAVAESAEANRIAVEANELAKDANTVSERALRISSENFEYEWGFRVEHDGVICITSESSHDAVDLTLLAEVQRAGKSIAPANAHYREAERVAYGAQLFFNVESIYPQLVSKARAQHRHVTAFVADRHIYDGRDPILFDVVAVMSWKTPGGSERGCTIKHSLSCREDKTGRIVFSMND